MPFSPHAFFDSFTRYLIESRVKALQYFANSASLEHWIQFEAAAWLNENRGLAGIDVGDWTIDIESKKTDLWLTDKQNRITVGIELKCVHNNKNCRGKVWELRRDLSDVKIRPSSYLKDTHLQFGIAVLIYLRYERGKEGGYSILGGVRDPWSLERFGEFFQSECLSTDSWHGVVPVIRSLKNVPIVQWCNKQASASSVCLALVSTEP